MAIPARAWRYSTDGAPSRASGRELTVWATDDIQVTSWIDLDLGLRATTTASSRNGEGDRHQVAGPLAEHQHHVARPSRRSPDAAHRRGPVRRAPPAQLPELRRSPRSVRDGSSLERPEPAIGGCSPAKSGVKIAAVGPCCANGRLNTIAADLHVPKTREILASLQTRLTDHLVLRLGGTDRRTSALIQPVNTLRHEWQLLADARRGHRPEPAGPRRRCRDPDLQPAAGEFRRGFLRAAERRAQHGARPRPRPRAGAARSTGDGACSSARPRTSPRAPAATAGSAPDENDQGVLGEVFSDPNASTEARGRLFFERGYVDQVVGDVSAAVRPAGRHRGALPGRPAFHARADRP